MVPELHGCVGEVRDDLLPSSKVRLFCLVASPSILVSLKASRPEAECKHRVNGRERWCLGICNAQVRRERSVSIDAVHASVASPETVEGSREMQLARAVVVDAARAPAKPEELTGQSRKAVTATRGWRRWER